MTAPLEGVRVLDLTRHLPGPMCTLWLAALGADVTKIEPPEGDPLRYYPPFDALGSIAFRAINRGKRSVVLDLKTPSDLEVLDRLVARSDVLVEGFRPGVIDRLGLPRERLAALRHDLIVCRISGFGQAGPRAGRGGHDLGYMALAGLLEPAPGTRNAGSAPRFQAADVAGGAMVATMRIVAALLGRSRTGEGADLDVSMTRGVAPLALVAHAEAHGDPDTAGLLAGRAAAYDVYPTSDERALAVGALEPKFFDALCAALGTSDAAGAGMSVETGPGSPKSTIEATLSTRPRDTWVDTLAEVDACTEPVLSPAEAQRNSALWGEAPPAFGFESVAALAIPFEPMRRLEDAPALGAHTAAVVAEVLT